MNAWMWCSILMLFGLIPCGILALTSDDVRKRLVAFEMTGIIAALEMMLLTMAFNRPPLMDLALAIALLSFGGGMVFAIFLGKHL
jgi:multisubunit Na+/H+ antiporter MnhF subunit